MENLCLCAAEGTNRAARWFAAYRLSFAWTTNMKYQFETLGNATILFFADGRPVLATDPWLTGTCYYGSWALEKRPTPEQIENVCRCPYIWISHGHPDHLHHESLTLIPRSVRLLIPDHYDRDIHDFLVGEGFDVTVLPFKTWVPVEAGLRVMCLDNPNQDAILVVEAGDALIIDLNDSPLCGEGPFLRHLGRRYAKRFVLALTAVDADMMNIIDAGGRRIKEPPEEIMPGAIERISRIVAGLGAQYFCCSSSQHIYVRADSVWANEYRVTWPKLQQYWTRKEVQLIEPFVTVDLEDCSYTRNHPVQEPDVSQITDATADDDWDERLTEEEWEKVAAFFRRFETIVDYVDFIEVAVGGERRRIALREGADRLPEGDANLRGITFFVPRRSLLTTVEYGYFDDLLIGNFMKTQLHNTQLYPNFTPLVSKLGGNAKVFTKAQHRRFLMRYFRRSPAAFVRWRAEEAFVFSVLPFFRRSAERLRIRGPAKRIYRWMIRA